MMSASSQSLDRFANTRWSVVMHAASGLSDDSRTALTELAQRYWYPVYAYVRRCGHAPAIAEEISRSFLGSLMRSFRDTGERPPNGHFRRYLLDQLNAFLASAWRAAEEDTANELAPPADLEYRNQRDNASTSTPEQAYQRSFALEVLARALKRLRKEAGQTGHTAMFEALQPHLAQDPVAGEYEAIARQLQIRPLALVVALKRLRQRFRELVGQELADTVSSAEDLAAEQSALHSILRESHTSQ